MTAGESSADDRINASDADAQSWEAFGRDSASYRFEQLAADLERAAGAVAVEAADGDVADIQAAAGTFDEVLARAECAVALLPDADERE